MPTGIAISAYNEHEEGRIDRLNQVRLVLIDLGMRVAAVHDHKGTLYVNWRERPTSQNVAEVATIWKSHAEHLVNHYVNGHELVLDMESHNPFA